MQGALSFGMLKKIYMIEFLKKIKKWLVLSVIPFFKMLFYNTVCKGYIELFGKHDTRKLKYGVSLCLIFKNEAPFLKEWLDYHLTIGVDHFYLYNNNSDDDYISVLKPYIEQGIVSLIEWPEQNSQFKCYKNCYDMCRTETKWISFLDADEFICPKYENNIKDWLVKYDKYHAINIQWLMFCTGGVIEHDYSKLVIEQYFSSWNDFWKHGKCIVNTQYDIANWNTWWVHHHSYMYRKVFGVNMILPAVNQFGFICTIDKIWGGGNNKLHGSTIQINHYFTKSWSIWSQKMKKTDVLFKKNPKSDINYFYKYEEKCISSNRTIQRFLIRMKLKQGIIK